MRFLPIMLTSILISPVFAEISSENERLNYAIGVKTGENLKMLDIELNSSTLIQGLQDSMQNKKLQLSEQEIDQTMQSLQKKQMVKMQQQQQQMAKDNLMKSEEFLAKNKNQSGVVSLASGLQYKVINKGDGNKPKNNDTVTVHYRGTLIDGTEFDSSYKRNQPATFKLNGLIAGWQEALQLMPAGSKWQIFLPPDLAYGENGAGPIIKPNSALIFDIELVSIDK